MKKVLGAVLKVGNCLNAGNKTRGQADGFQIEAISKAMNIKDKTGIQNVMQLICKVLSEEDKSFLEFKSNFKECFESCKYFVEDIVNHCHR